MLTCYWLGTVLLLELGYSALGLGQLTLRIFLLLFQAFILRHHVLGAISDCGKFPVDFDQGRVEGWEFNVDSSFIDIPHSPNFI